MKKQRWIVFLLLFPALVMLAVTILPHHHHDNGTLCLHSPETEAESAETGEHHTAPCLDDCIAKFNPAENISEYSLSRIHFLLILPLTGCVIESVGVPAADKGSSRSGFQLYAERLHGITPASSAGLRAPPRLIG